MTSAPDLIPTREACEILDLTPSGISRLVDRGEMKPAIQGPGQRGAFLFRRSDVQKLAAKRAEEAGASERAAS